jgi:predicted small integral membrane protein
VRFVLPLAIVCAVIASAISAGSATAVSACGRSGYSYAGFVAAAPAHGVRASVVALGNPYVENGHVAAWVGVSGGNAWIQVGLSAFAGTGSRLYFEVNRPGVGPRYTQVLPQVEPGSRHRIAVLEILRRSGWWRVWVDGKPVSDPVYLRGSSGRWAPMATAETWDGGRRVCNLFAYRFDRLATAGPGGAWRRLTRGHRFQDPGYRVVGTPGGFLARAVRPLPKAGSASAEDPDGSPGPDVPLEVQDGAVADPNAAVGDGLTEVLGDTRPVDADDPAAGPLAQP